MAMKIMLKKQSHPIHAKIRFFVPYLATLSCQTKNTVWLGEMFQSPGLRTIFSRLRCFSTAKHYAVLNISPDPNSAPTDSDIKKAFIKLSLRVHPDLATEEDAKEAGKDLASLRKERKAEFIHVRNAFESLISGDEGNESDEKNESKRQPKWDNWFGIQTNGARFAFEADESTRNQMLETAKLSRGGLDKGGLWGLVDMMEATKDKHGGDVENSSGGGGLVGDGNGNFRGSSSNRRRRRRR